MDHELERQVRGEPSYTCGGCGEPRWISSSRQASLAFGAWPTRFYHKGAAHFICADCVVTAMALLLDTREQKLREVSLMEMPVPLTPTEMDDREDGC